MVKFVKYNYLNGADAIAEMVHHNPRALTAMMQLFDNGFHAVESNVVHSNNDEVVLVEFIAKSGRLTTFNGMLEISVDDNDIEVVFR